MHDLLRFGMFRSNAKRLVLALCYDYGINSALPNWD